MSFQFSKPLRINFAAQRSAVSFDHAKAILLIGSCFSDNIASKLKQYKFTCLSNPFGVSYNPISISNSIQYIVAKKQFTDNDLFLHNDLYNSWEHHSSFSSTESKKVLQNINDSISEAHHFIKTADSLFITLGSAYVYRLQSNNAIVANCHKGPASWFSKSLLTCDEVVQALQRSIDQLKLVNPKINIFFTVSPVRHIKDGLIENNRSKAVLLQAVHELCDAQQAAYFPSYELLIDDLRDYRFFAEDLVHPNQLAIDYVWEYFSEVFFENKTKILIKEIAAIVNAYQHRPTNLNTEAHKKFITAYLQKLNELISRFPHLDFENELTYFSSHFA